jgi:ACR3 family arsenite efflux pump ArsB
MKYILTKKNIFFSKLFAIICLSTYSSIILLRNFSKDFNQFLVLATILFIISLIVLTYKLRKDYISINDNVNKKSKLKFIEIFNFIGGLLVVIMILLKKFEIVPGKLMDIAYIFIISILFFNIIAKIRKEVE